jgi:hypothetical protein
MTTHNVHGNHLKDLFEPYRTMYEALGVNSTSSPFDFYQENIYEYANNLPDDSIYPILLDTFIMEYQYYMNEAPLFKVPSSMIHAMLHTCIDRIPIHDLKLPFSSFSIILPQGNPTGISQILLCLYASKAFLSRYEEVTPHQSWNLCMRTVGTITKTFSITINPHNHDYSVRDCINTTRILVPSISNDERDMELKAWKIAISTLLLATGAQKHFQNDVMDHLMEEFWKCNPRIPVKIRPHNTHNNSSESTSRPGSHRKLVKGTGNNTPPEDHIPHHHAPKREHQRGGHWRRQACGKEWKQHKNIFINSFKAGRKRSA